jgi:hypothetical protein
MSPGYYEEVCDEDPEGFRELPKDGDRAYLTQAAIRRNLLNSKRTLVPKPHRAVLARALQRVPERELIRLMSLANFVVVGPTSAEYLSGTLVREWESLIVLGERLPELPEEEQVRTILTAAAHALLRSRHPCEPPADYPNPVELLYDEDGREKVGLGYDRGRRAYEEGLKVYKGEATNLKIDVYLAEKRAAVMVEGWLDQWEQYKRRHAAALQALTL